jgi:dynein heavy chain
MNLVLFEAAVEHVVKISRIIATEFGHALLIGVGGSGRKSLTKLSIAINLMDPFEIEINKSYDISSWKDDMRENLFMNCGVFNSPYVFLFSDTQIINEAFLEDVNNILNNGEIPNLYGTTEEQSNLIDNMREEEKRFKDFGDNEIMAEFYVRCKANIHVVLAMSPIGDDYKRRLRMFPSLVNCCAIDWFLPWPKEALVSVAQQFVKDIEDLPSVEGVVQICVDMQMRTTSLSEKYKEREKRFYYVTPTSYLVLIQAFKDLLEKKRIEIFSLITKYDTGIKQLADANKEVDVLKGKLIELMPKLQVA